MTRLALILLLLLVGCETQQGCRKQKPVNIADHYKSVTNTPPPNSMTPIPFSLRIVQNVDQRSFDVEMWYPLPTWHPLPNAYGVSEEAAREYLKKFESIRRGPKVIYP